MRYRKPKNYHEKLVEYHSDILISGEKSTKNKWSQIFGNDNEIHLEIGMGKGKFLLEHAKRYPHINYIGIEKIEPLLLHSARRVREENLQNVRLFGINANFLEDYFGESEISRIYLNFSDPWPKTRNANRRLTHSNMLKKYVQAAMPNSKLCFKTDNKSLFEFSVCEISKYGLEISELQIDLYSHNFDIQDERIIKTEYESKFMEMGKVIYRLESILK